MNLRNLPIEEVLAQICQATNLYFRVDKNAVTIFSIEETNIEKKLNSIIIPVVDFENTTIGEAFQLLREYTREFDNTTEIDNHKGINIVIKGIPGSVYSKGILLKNVPVSEVLNEFCIANDILYRVDQNAVTIYPSEEVLEVITIIENKLDTIIIPSVEFKNASLRDTLRTLRKFARELDNTTEKGDEKGINIILRNKTDIRNRKDLKPRVINASFTNVSLGKILRDICQTFNARCEIHRYALTVIETEESTLYEKK